MTFIADAFYVCNMCGDAKPDPSGKKKIIVDNRRGLFAKSPHLFDKPGGISTTKLGGDTALATPKRTSVS
jgi:hypothetical protein